MTRRLLIGTTRYLLLVDIVTGEQTILNKKYGLFYGITWDNDHYYIAGRWHQRFWPTSRYERPRVLTLDRNLDLVKTSRIPVPAGGIHQIVYQNDKLYCSCSREDSYVIRDGKDWSVWYPSKDPQHYDNDTHHFNSIWFEGNSMFIIGHNNGPSDVWELKYPERELVDKYRVGRYIHNVWREGDDLLVCNSGDGRIETVGGRIVCETGGFPRGVVAGPDINVIGISGVASRANRLHTRGILNVYSKEWDLRETIDLGLCGQVCEIRSLDDEDFAHNGIAPPL